MSSPLRAAAIAIVSLAAPAAAQGPASWTEPAAPFQITDDIAYVGSKGLAAYLIRGSDGLILIDGTMAENVPAIERNIQALGFKLSDVKLLLNSHAHFDHAAGLAQLKADTGARLVASAADRRALETGVPPSVVSYGVVRFPPVTVDDTLADGRPVRLGNLALTPMLTPGHTPGCTTWSTTSTYQGRAVRVVFPCSQTVAGNKLVGNSGYPGIVADYRRSFPKMAALKADIVLPFHPEAGDLMARAERQRAGERGAFLAPDLLQRITAQSKATFEAELAKEQAAAR